MASEDVYMHLREGFMKCHQNESNVLLHLFTGGLGVIGACCLVYRCSNRSLGTLALLITLYAASLVGTVPLNLVLVVLAFLMGVVIPLVRAADVGVTWSIVTVVVAYLGNVCHSLPRLPCTSTTIMITSYEWLF